MKRNTTAEFTINKFAEIVGIDRRSLAEKIEASRIKPTGRESSQGAPIYKLRDLFKAASGGDERAERLRKTTEEADKLALANARTRGELVEVAAVKRLGARIMVAIRGRILQMPLTDDEKDKCLTELLGLAKLDWSRDA